MSRRQGRNDRRRAAPLCKTAGTAMVRTVSRRRNGATQGDVRPFSPRTLPSPFALHFLGFPTRVARSPVSTLGGWTGVVAPWRRTPAGTVTGRSCELPRVLMAGAARRSNTRRRTTAEAAGARRWKTAGITTASSWATADTAATCPCERNDTRTEDLGKAGSAAMAARRPRADTATARPYRTTIIAVAGRRARLETWTTRPSITRHCATGDNATGHPCKTAGVATADLARRHILYRGGGRCIGGFWPAHHERTGRPCGRQASQRHGLARRQTPRLG